MHVVLGEQLVHQVLAVAEAQPGVHLRVLRPNGSAVPKVKAGVLAEVVVAGGVAHLDGAVLHRVEHLQAGHDFAGREDLDLEFVVGHFGDALGEIFAAAIERIERLRPARRHAPFDLRHRLRDGRRRNGGRGGKPDARGFQEFTTFHWRFPC